MIYFEGIVNVKAISTIVHLTTPYLKKHERLPAIFLFYLHYISKNHNALDIFSGGCTQQVQFTPQSCFRRWFVRKRYGYNPPKRS